MADNNPITKKEMRQLLEEIFAEKLDFFQDIKKEN